MFCLLWNFFCGFHIVQFSVHSWVVGRKWGRGGVRKCNQREIKTPVINQSSACKVHIWPPDLLYSSVSSFTDCRSRAVSTHINCTCALRSLERKHRHSSHMYSSGFSIVTVCCFSLFCMSYVDKLWSHFLFHQRCVRRNPHPIVDMAIRHVTD